MPNIIILDARTLTEEQEVKMLLGIHKYMVDETPDDCILPIGIFKGEKLQTILDVAERNG